MELPNKKIIIERALQKCLELRSRQMEQVTEDYRMTFISSVIALECALASDLDEYYKEFREQQREKEQKLLRKFGEKEYLMKELPNGEQEKHIVNIFIPELNSSTPPIWQQRINQYRNLLTKIYTEILEQLVLLIKRIST